MHPFADGNGRTARLVASAMLTRHGMTPGRMFNFDAHYGKAKNVYLDALRSVVRTTRNHETWMRYFLSGLIEEYERVQQEVDRLAAIGRTGRGARVQLTGTQERALTQLAISNRVEFTREEYQEAAGVRKSSAVADLRRLVGDAVVVSVGSGPSRRYRLAALVGSRRRAAGRETARDWTDARIEAELRRLVGHETRFPSVRRFDEAGRRDLYGAIVRHGGSQLWAARLRLEPPRRGRPSKT